MSGRRHRSRIFAVFFKDRAGQAPNEVLYTRPLMARVLYGADGVSEEMTATSRLLTMHCGKSMWPL